MKSMRKRECRRRQLGFTLVELMLALVIIAVIGTAISAMLMAACNTNRYSTAQSTAMWDADMAWHRILSNGRAAVPASTGGMTPTVTTDSNGQSHLTLIVPDGANNTTRKVQYYCTGSSAPYTLVEDDPRYDSGGSPSVLASNVTAFSVALDSSTTMKIWTTLTITPSGGWGVTRHFCAQCRGF